MDDLLSTLVLEYNMVMMMLIMMTDLLAYHRALLFVLNLGSPGQNSCEIHCKDLKVSDVTCGCIHDGNDLI